jgi:hypothetical protein
MYIYDLIEHFLIHSFFLTPNNILVNVHINTQIYPFSSCCNKMFKITGHFW